MVEGYIARGIAVYMVRPHTTYDNYKVPCHNQANEPSVNTTGPGSRLNRWCGPQRMLFAGAREEGPGQLPTNLIDYLRPHIVTQQHEVIGFIVHPLLAAAEGSVG
eukprot:SAG22_NODE_709_length_7742_cov_2.383488_1_plen_105_part_00